MNVSSVSSPNTEQLGTVQGQAQVAMLKKQMDMQEQQVAQLLQSVPRPQPVQPGQPGSIINTFA